MPASKDAIREGLIATDLQNVIILNSHRYNRLKKLLVEEIDSLVNRNELISSYFWSKIKFNRTQIILLKLLSNLIKNPDKEGKNLTKRALLIERDLYSCATKEQIKIVQSFKSNLGEFLAAHDDLKVGHQDHNTAILAEQNKINSSLAGKREWYRELKNEGKIIKIPFITDSFNVLLDRGSSYEMITTAAIHIVSVLTLYNELPELKESLQELIEALYAVSLNQHDARF